MCLIRPQQNKSKSTFKRRPSSIKGVETTYIHTSLLKLLIVNLGVVLFINNAQVTPIYDTPDTWSRGRCAN